MSKEFDFEKIKLAPEAPGPARARAFSSNPPTSRAANKEPPKDRHIGCPLAWFKRALAAVKSKDQLAVALYIYRRSVVCKSTTIPVSNKGLQDDLGIGRGAKHRALKCLAAAGMISYEVSTGNATLVTILGRSQYVHPPARNSHGGARNSHAP